MKRAHNGSLFIVATVALAVLGLNFYWLYSTRSGYVKLVTQDEEILQGEQQTGITEKLSTTPPPPHNACKDAPWQPAVPRTTTAPLLGKRRNRRGFLTIGIPSVERHERYLEQTLSSLMEKSTEQERHNVTLVVFLADMDPKVRDQRANRLEEAFKEPLQSGFIQVIEAPSCLYPDLDFRFSRKTFGDSPERVRWRAKQVLDFSYLITYSLNLSEFYLVLEDDVACADRYLTAIREFISLHSDHRWVALQFSGFLSIGQTLRNEDLPRLVQLLKMFYREQPVDFLLQYFIRLLVPDAVKPTRRIPGLFQHQGVHSTLSNKTQKLRDSTFNAVPPRTYHSTNPSADLVTSMQTYRDFHPEYAYSPAPGMFWGIPKPGDTFDIVFPHPLVLQRVAVVTGDGARNPPDRLTDGELEASDVFLSFERPDRVLCRGFVTLASFVEGKVDVPDVDQVFPTGVQCLRIQVGPKQRSWIIITEIAVFASPLGTHAT